MSKIDTLIQELQQKKKKLDYLDYIKDLLSGDQKCVDYVEIQDEVLQKLLPLIDKVATEIEDSVVSETKTSTTEQLSSDEIKILKGAAQKVMAQVSQSQAGPPALVQETPKAPPSKSGKKEHLPAQDKMSFAMDNRHLGGKVVRVLDKNTNQVITTGTVVGLDAPNVVVKTVEGPTIEVPLSKILLGESA